MTHFYRRTVYPILLPGTNWHSPSLKHKALPPRAWRTKPNPSIIANPSCALRSRTRLLLCRLEVWKWRGSRARVGPCGERCSRLDTAPSLSHVFSLLDTSSHSCLVVQRLLRKTEQLPVWWEDSGCCTRENDLAKRVDCRWKTATKEERARKSRYYSILSSTGQPAGQVFATGQQVQRGWKHVGPGNPHLIKGLKVTGDRLRLRVESGENWGKAELITHSITIIKRLLAALCLNMLFVIYYSLKEKKRSPSFLFKTKTS